MKNQFWKNLKYYWLLINFILLVLPVFLPSSRGRIGLIELCLMPIIAASFPLNILPVWLGVVTGFLNGSIGSIFLIMFVLSLVGYFQWFVVVPRLVRFLRRQFGKIKLRAVAGGSAALLESGENVGWRRDWYDARKRTPVERLFDDERE